MSCLEADEGQNRAKRYKIRPEFGRNVRNRLTQHGNPWNFSCAGVLNRSKVHLGWSCNVLQVNLTRLDHLAGDGETP